MNGKQTTSPTGNPATTFRRQLKWLIIAIVIAAAGMANTDAKTIEVGGAEVRDDVAQPIVPSVAAALSLFESGLVGKMSANIGCVFPHFHKLSVYGTEATFVNESEHGLLLKSREQAHPPQKIMAAYPGTHKGELIYSFVDSILNDTPAEISANEVFNSMSVCLAIEKATQRPGSVTVNYI